MNERVVFVLSLSLVHALRMSCVERGWLVCWLVQNIGRVVLGWGPEGRIRSYEMFKAIRELFTWVGPALSGAQPSVISSDVHAGGPARAAF
jgi:hypothetical protein